MGCLSVEVPAPAAGGWLKLNSQQRGYYRVNYDTAGWRALTEALLRDHQVSPGRARERAGSGRRTVRHQLTPPPAVPR